MTILKAAGVAIAIFGLAYFVSRNDWLWAGLFAVLVALNLDAMRRG